MGRRCSPRSFPGPRPAASARTTNTELAVLGHRARSGSFRAAGPAATSSAFIPARLVLYALGVVGRVAVAHAVLTGHSVTAARREAVHVLVDE